MLNETFLVEIGTEELPPKKLRNLAELFAKIFTTELKEANIAHGNIEWFATPRRLALKVANLNLYQSDIKIEKRGPSLTKAFDKEGKPTKAAKCWASCCGITVNNAERLTTEKGEWLLYRAHIKGEKSEVLLPNIVTNSITKLTKLPIFKLMRISISNVHFVRPVHTIILLLGDKVIPANILGLKSDRIIYGHRFMGENKFIIHHANQYPEILLKRGKVIADFNARKAIIKTNAEKAARNIDGNLDLSNQLLEEITSLVEWPVVITAKFEKNLINIPEEIIAYLIKAYRYYIPVYNNNKKLLPYFIFVANIESKDQKQIILGNEKVVRQRLYDAAFFFKIDRKKRLEDYLPKLQKVLFQQQLGTMLEKTYHIQALAGFIAKNIGANVKHASRAGLLSKCDLITNMVLEFPSTQGLIGMYYALNDGEPEDVAIALNEQYKPSFSGDTLPSNNIACAVAIADKIDTITGILGISKYSYFKGDQDPFGLRRAALGILRIIVNKNLSLDLQSLTEEAVRLYSNKLTNVNVVKDVIDFMLGRFRVLYEEKGYTVDTIKAVLSLNYTYIKPADLDARIKAVSYFRKLEVAYYLANANKRVSNIIAKANTTNIIKKVFKASELKEEAEIKLANKLIEVRSKLNKLFVEARYKDALINLASLRELIDDFFKKVLVNTNDENQRINRLMLLAELQKLFQLVADISLLQINKNK